MLPHLCPLFALERVQHLAVRLEISLRGPLIPRTSKLLLLVGVIAEELSGGVETRLDHFFAHSVVGQVGEAHSGVSKVQLRPNIWKLLMYYYDLFAL